MLSLLLLPLAETPPLSTFQVDQVCDRVAGLSMPAADAKPPAGSPSLEGCNAAAAWYGLGTPRDPVRARLCAARDLAAGDDEILGGSAILLMIYANGEGVPRNPDLAAHYACSNDYAGAERDLRVSHVLALGPGEKLDFCDDATSGFMGGFCADMGERIAAQARDQRVEQAVAALPAEAREHLPALKSALEDYIDARVGGEIDTSGTGGAAARVWEAAHLRDAFADAVARTASPGFPPAADDQAYAAADRALNQAYKEAMSGPDLPDAMITHAARRTAERAWLRYRDAWVAFGAAARPDLPASTWLTWATLARLEDMQRPG